MAFHFDTRPRADILNPQAFVPRDGGGMIALSDFAGKKLVLFFYPRADTPGCTREAIDFTRLVLSILSSASRAILAEPVRAPSGPT